MIFTACRSESHTTFLHSITNTISSFHKSWHVISPVADCLLELRAGYPRILPCPASLVPIFTSNISGCYCCCQLWQQALLACCPREISSSGLTCSTMCKLPTSGPGGGRKDGSSLLLCLAPLRYPLIFGIPLVDKTPTCTASRILETISTPLIF